MIFNGVNFHGHLRLSSVCKRWHNLVRNDIGFMRSIKFHAQRLQHHDILARSYKSIDLSGYAWCYSGIPANLQKQLKDVETLDFGYYVTTSTLNCVIPLCKSLKEVRMTKWYPSHQPPVTFRHPLPVRIVMMEPCIEFLDHLNVITELANMRLENVPTPNFVAKYGSAITSLDIRLNKAFDNLVQFENLHLQSVRIIEFYDNVPVNPDALRAFFKKQAPSLKSLHLDDISDSDWFDEITILKKLETLKFTCNVNHWEQSQRFHLDDLRELKNLQSLDIDLEEDSFGGDAYELDIYELTTLTDFRIHGDFRFKIYTVGQPMIAMRKIDISCGGMKLDELERLVRLMPELKVFGIKIWVRKEVKFYFVSVINFSIFTPQSKKIFNEADSFKAAAQFNKLQRLESLTETGSQTFLTNSFLSKLALPELRYLQVYVV
jgi:hypothetical protein